MQATTEDIIKAMPPGAALYDMAQVKIDDKYKATAVFMIREDKNSEAARCVPIVRIHAAGMTVDVLDHEVLVVPIVLQVGIGKAVAFYELWINFHNGDLGKALCALLSRQEFVYLVYYDCKSKFRAIQVRNEWKEFFIKLYPHLQRSKPWSMEVFDQAKLKVRERHQTVQSLCLFIQEESRK